jgi:hypothetical protein
MWFGLAFLALGCACPEKKVEQPAPAMTEPAPAAVPEPAPAPSVEPAAAPAPAPAPPPAPAPAPAPAPRATPTPAPAPAPAPAPRAELPSTAGAKCDDTGCGGGFTCVKYYGIAGARGPEFRSCEIPCSQKSKCPKGTTCTTIADGPGQVCR